MSEPVANGLLADFRERTVRGMRVHGHVAGYCLAWAMGVCFLSAAGAYDSDEIAAGPRLLLWTVMLGLILWQSVLLFRTMPGLSVIWRIPLVLALVTVLTSLEVHALKYTPVVPYAPDPIFGFIAFMAPAVVPLSLAVVLIETARARQQKRYGQDPAPTLAAGWPDADIGWIKASDHYLEIGLKSGRTLFLRGTMQDVESRLAGLDGERVHRSWWVSREDVERVISRGRDKVLILRDGIEIPIGRSRIARLRKAGWLS